MKFTLCIAFAVVLSLSVITVDAGSTHSGKSEVFFNLFFFLNISKKLFTDQTIMDLLSRELNEKITGC